MLVNNSERLNIVKQLTNMYDYAEFVSACSRANVKPLQALDYAQKVGMLSCAIIAYPGITEAEAYLKFVQENQHKQEPPSISNVWPEGVVVVAKPDCGGCGGGKVR